MDSIKDSITFEIAGLAKGKGRPRFRNVGSFVQTYTDKETATWENFVRLSYINSGGKLMTGCLAVLIQSYFPVPKSYSKKKQKELMHAPFPHKPDCDNLAKSILDALNGIAFDDDMQVIMLTVGKFYSDTAKTVVTIGELEEGYHAHVANSDL